MTMRALYDPETDTIDLDGKYDLGGRVRYLGKARRRTDERGPDRGIELWVCLADVGGALCMVEVLMRPLVVVDRDPGDEDVPRRSR